jgi:hypothetical protein
LAVLVRTRQQNDAGRTGTQPPHRLGRACWGPGVLVHENRALLARRAALQAAIDARYRAQRGKGDVVPAAQIALWQQIGQLQPDMPDSAIKTCDPNPKGATVAGPQKVVPGMNGRDALNAAADARLGPRVKMPSMARVRLPPFAANTGPLCQPCPKFYVAAGDPAAKAAALRKMAAIVDAPDAGDVAFQAMARRHDSAAFQAACDLVFKGRSQPSGFTARRPKKPQDQGTPPDVLTLWRTYPRQRHIALTTRAPRHIRPRQCRC